jgi:methylmalonyl-CoA mutase cobalamin-binding subunit
MAFKKGISGNPKGRPPGSGLRQLLVPHAPALVNKAVELALDGNETALRICVDRILPALKAESLPVTMSGIEGTLAEQGAGVLRALVLGGITPDHGIRMLQVMQALASVEATTELEERIAKLEEKVEEKTP